MLHDTIKSASTYHLSNLRVYAYIHTVICTVFSALVWISLSQHVLILPDVFTVQYYIIIVASMYLSVLLSYTEFTVSCSSHFRCTYACKLFFFSLLLIFTFCGAEYLRVYFLSFCAIFNADLLSAGTVVSNSVPIYLSMFVETFATANVCQTAGVCNMFPITLCRCH